MRAYDVSFRSPARNLAVEEALLDQAESGEGPETLRFWEASAPFVVLGVSQAVRENVYESACREANVGIYRRASAGGCVLQGPGCLNYTLILHHANHPDARTIRGSYCYIFDKITAALETRGLAVKHKGTSDIALNGRKVSGNAQKRRKNAFLHHGTLLYDFDLESIERYLREPTDRPGYRGDRTHSGFVRNLPLSRAELVEAICEAFGADALKARLPERTMRISRELEATKYKLPQWIFRR
jgi:lipoate---protein ligase